MYGFFGRLINSFRRFMYGRYGIDELSKSLLITGIIMTLLASFRWLAWLSLPALLIIFWAYFRCFSKKFDARRRELYAYQRLRTNARDRVSLLRRIIRERKTHKHFRCRLCRTRLRVPRGKGKIEVTCPKCRAKVIKKT